jgi:hypothetical protein
VYSLSLGNTAIISGNIPMGRPFQILDVSTYGTLTSHRLVLAWYFLVTNSFHLAFAMKNIGRENNNKTGGYM